MQRFDRGAIREIIDRCLELYPCDVDIRYDEPMGDHTTFKVGGPAGCFLRPQGESFPLFSAALVNYAHAASIPVLILGGGANVVVSDNGIHGIVLDTGGWKGCSAAGEGIIVKSGTSMDEAAEYAAAAGLTGLEFLAGMPGSIGGAVWMNARCYGSEIADVLEWTGIINSGKSAGNSDRIMERIVTEQLPEGTGFGYKHSPFQEMDCLILWACFKLRHGEENAIRDAMEKNRRDRREKGHYLFPCAGSAFKNNREFGKPTGQIIDELGLRGFQLGGAQVAPFHGNIIINTGNATAADIHSLMDEVAAKVKAATGFVLEPEILFVGD
jgi:UDP-N-acetylmuramate dehydrogenase